MDCPHCQTENLIGATRCASCGESMFSRNRFGPVSTDGMSMEARSSESALAAPPLKTQAPETSAAGAPTRASTAPPAESAAPEQAMCRVCRTPCDIAPGDAAAQAVCLSCKILAEMNAAAASGDVRPETIAEANAEFKAKLGTTGNRPRVAAPRRKVIRTGPVAVVVAVALTLLCLAIVKIADRRPDVAAKLLGDVRAESADFVVAPATDRVFGWDTTLRLNVVRDEARATYSDLQTTLSLTQVSVQTCQARPVRTEDGVSVLDINSECSLREQTGRSRGDDARDLDIYPFRAHQSSARFIAAPTAPTSSFGTGDALPGRELPPFLTAGDLGARSLRASPGDRWRAPLRLTVLCDAEGRLFTATFPADVVYAGRAVRRGFACAAFRVNAAPPTDLPRALAERMNRSDGEIAGAVFIELSTGLVVDATLDLDVSLRREGSRIEDALRITGRYEVRRR